MKETKKYYKTAVGMLAAAFSEAGYKDDFGNPIQPEKDDPGMSYDEYIEWKKSVLLDSLKPFVKNDEK